MTMSIKVSKVKINGKVDFNSLKPFLRKKMHDILAEHSRNYQGSRGPDGSIQKDNSPEYAKRKNNPGIKVGSQLRRGNKPLYLTGEMIASRQVRTSNNTISAVFEGSAFGATNAQKAAFLIDKGYKLHYFSKQQKDDVLKSVADEMLRQINKTIDIK